MSLNKESILDALRQVQDPVTGQDIVSMQRVRDVQVEGNQVQFSLELPSLDATTKSDINFACQAAVASVYPKAQVHVHMVSRLVEGEAERVLPQVKNIIAVGSGKGGVGKSTVAVNLALGLQALGAKVGLMDADLYGPSMPTMLGLQGKRPRVETIYGQHKIIPLEAYGMPVISMGFIIEPDQAVVLRGPRLGGIIKQFVNEVIWPSLDYLIIDLPPGTGDIQLTLVQTVPITGAILVTTPQQVAVVDAIKAMNMFLLPSVNVPVLGVVENMAWFTPAELPNNKYYLFGQGGGKALAKESNTVLLGQIPIVQSIQEGGDQGKPAVIGENGLVKDAFLALAKQAAIQIAIRNEQMEPTRLVKMNA